MTREEVVEELQYIHDGLVACELSYEALEIAIKTLSADVVEVVRCKDCIFLDNYSGGNICRNVNGKAWAKPDDFCNEGRNKIE